jgi:hypothetical protein
VGGGGGSGGKGDGDGFGGGRLGGNSYISVLAQVRQADNVSTSLAHGNQKIQSWASSASLTVVAQEVASWAVGQDMLGQRTSTSWVLHTCCTLPLGNSRTFCHLDRPLASILQNFLRL